MDVRNIETEALEIVVRNIEAEALEMDVRNIEAEGPSYGTKEILDGLDCHKQRAIKTAASNR